jgi:hypothetical protein
MLDHGPVMGNPHASTNMAAWRSLHAEAAGNSRRRVEKAGDRRHANDGDGIMWSRPPPAAREPLRASVRSGGMAR